MTKQGLKTEQMEDAPAASDSVRALAERLYIANWQSQTQYEASSLVEKCVQAAKAFHDYDWSATSN